MEIDVEIDEFTPCLIESATGKKINTKYKHVNVKEVPNSNAGWLFNWVTPFSIKGCEVVALYLEDGNEIQGLVAFTPIQNENTVRVEWVEAAPHNRGSSGKYIGTGAHMFSIAIQKSIDLGFGGHIYFRAKAALIDYYTRKLGARLVSDNIMQITEEDAQKLCKEYMEGSACDE